MSVVHVADVQGSDADALRGQFMAPEDVAMIRTDAYPR
jgi:hypothetical protein